MGNKRMAKTVQRMDVICQILREENGLTVGSIAARMSWDLVGARQYDSTGEAIRWDAERLSWCTTTVNQVLRILENEGTIYGLRGTGQPNLWWLTEEAMAKAPLVDEAIVAEIEAILK